MHKNKEIQRKKHIARKKDSVKKKDRERKKASDRPKGREKRKDKRKKKTTQKNSKRQNEREKKRDSERNYDKKDKEKQRNITFKMDVGRWSANKDDVKKPFITDASDKHLKPIYLEYINSYAPTRYYLIRYNSIYLLTESVAILGI